MKKIYLGLGMFAFLQSCEMTAGYSKPCRDEKGGIKSVYFIQLEHISSMTVSASKEVTAIVLTAPSGGTARAWRYKLEMNLSSFTDTLTGSRDNGTLFSAQQLTMILNDNRQATRNQLMLLAQNDLVAIVELANGDFEMLGAYNGLTLTTDERASGVIKSDRSGHTITMDGQEDELAFKVDSTIIAGLVIPVS